MTQQPSSPKMWNSRGLSISQLQAMSLQELREWLRTEEKDQVGGLLNDLLEAGRYMELLAAAMADNLNAQPADQQY